ncbi:MarR family winged helix-turn-helix transcriptional regulator [Roseibium aggregatum]|uniref:MarR family transcriptional regulator n=1 Tax=Roseibium aggregatum TaxID=187304 RepID=A0A926NVK4_9HYPH|nr:MarR family transcriptional regulator [Roseibium aggregatum]MBD1546044.1 MarR family transcriptional regulator [Roseibium aggregatum]
MSKTPSEIETAAWARLIRASTYVLAAVEADLKKQGFPPLGWYDVLLELKRERDGALSPSEIENRTLLAQYNISRLLARLETAGYVSKEKSETDGRSVVVRLTGEGVELLKRMWPAYAAAIHRHFSARLEEGDAEQLGAILARLLPDRSPD